MPYFPQPKEKEIRDSLHRAMPPAAAGCLSLSQRMKQAVACCGLSRPHFLWVSFTADDPQPENQDFPPSAWSHADVIWRVPTQHDPGFKMPKTVARKRVEAGSSEFAALLAALRPEEAVGIPRLRNLLPMPMPAESV